MNLFIEWLAEWSREFCRRQRGLLLMTAHRAKGLEFDHVVALARLWELPNKRGVVVAPLAKSFNPPIGTQCGSATVLAIVGWCLDASKPEYRIGMKCDAWEFIMPELIFEPDRQSASQNSLLH